MSEVNKIYTEDEIIDILEKNLSKEKSLSFLTEMLNISELSLFSYVKKIKNKGINIDFYERDGESYFVKNNQPDLSKENSYYIESDVNSFMKIAFISDLRFGSKAEQIGILMDMYKKFLADGVKYVIIVGNLLEGIYSKKEYDLFGKSLITNSGKDQADHFIDYFPKVNGIKTLFVTGKLDHKCNKLINIGEYITSKRNDMVYLGPVSCNLYFNKICFRVEQLDKGDAYTVSYPHQKYSRSMSSYQDYDAVFLGGALNAQYFPQIRNTQIFSIPSVCDRTPKMQNKNLSNTIGSLIIDIEYNKMGKLKRLVPTFNTYDNPSKEIYLNIQKDDSKNIDKRKDRNNNFYFSNIDNLYRKMRKEESFNDSMKRLNLTEEELYGLIEALNNYGKNAEIIDINSELIIRKNSKSNIKNEIKIPKEELHKKEILVVSDTHYGSIYSQPSMVNTACYEAYNRGITDFFHVGDICDGDYSRVRPINVYEVFLYGATGQLDYTSKVLPKYPNVKWHGICGSHDQTHLFNYGVDFGKELAKLRPDFEYLGQDRAIYKLNNCKIDLFHPGDGTSRIISTKPQNGIDQMPSKTKADIMLQGHYHKIYYMIYRNMHFLLVPCCVSQSSFMMKKSIPNLMGASFLTLYYDDTGYIHYLIPEFMTFSENEVRKNDWENPKKYIKNKIITPCKR